MVVYGWDCEGGDDGVGVVVSLDVGAEEGRAFEVEEGAVEELEGFGWMARARGESCWVLMSMAIFHLVRPYVHVLFLSFYLSLGFLQDMTICIHTVYILAQRQEPLPPLLRQLRQRKVRRIRLRLQRHMPSIVVKLPHQRGIHAKCFRGSELRCIMGSPETTRTTEGGEAR